MNLRILLLILLLPLTACSLKTGSDEEIKDPKILMQEAMDEYKDANYKKAVENYELIEREFPATVFATEAEVRRAYTLYIDDKFDDAIAVVDDFISQYPAYKSAPYMLYLKGICYYDQIIDVERDQQISQKAIDAFDELINRFPKTEYARDAKLKREFAYNSLAGKEMKIGRFYLSKNNYLAAINRFRYIIQHYQNTIFIEEALYRLTEVYYKLGDLEQAQKYASVLGYNYPKSKWYELAYGLLSSGKVKNPSVIEKFKRIW